MMRARPLLPGLSLMAGLMLLLAACAPQQAAAPRPEAPATAPRATTPAPGSIDLTRPVRVALLVPRGGTDPGTARVAESLVNAAGMAAEDLGDPLLDIVILDTRGTPEGARAAAERAVAEGARLILGPLFSASTRAVADVAAVNGLSVISFSTDTGAAGGPVFLSGYLPEREAERIIAYAAGRGYDRIAIFHPANAYGLAARRGAEEAARRFGAGLLFALDYPRTFKGIEANAPRFAEVAINTGVNAVLLPDEGQGLSAAAAFLDYSGLDPAEVKYLGLGQWNTPATLREATLRGGWFPAPDPALVEAFAGRYEARFGTRPPLIAALGYDAVQVAGQLLALAREGVVADPFAPAAITRPEGFDGAFGRLAFEPGGLNRRALAVLEVGEERFEVVDPPPTRLDLGS